MSPQIGDFGSFIDPDGIEYSCRITGIEGRVLRISYVRDGERIDLAYISIRDFIPG